MLNLRESGQAVFQGGRSGAHSHSQRAVAKLPCESGSMTGAGALGHQAPPLLKKQQKTIVTKSLSTLVARQATA